MNELNRKTHLELWMLTVSPLIWAAHFLACYITAAIWCAKAGAVTADLTTVRVSIAIYTAIALAGVAMVGWRGMRRHGRRPAGEPHDADTVEDRRRFLGFATMLLSGLSFIAVIYSGIVALYFRSCI